jgi:hypothetical protein
VKQIGVIKKDGKLMACSLDTLVYLTCCGEELFNDLFEIVPTGETVNIKEHEVFGSIDLDNKVKSIQK